MRTYRSRFFVPWGDCDAAGIVFYPHMYVWFDRATEHLFRANGITYDTMEEILGTTGMPLLETGASYLNQCKLGDEMEMETWVDEWAARTFLVRHVVSHAGGQKAVEGYERRALLAPAPERPKGVRAIEIPQDLIDRFVD